MQLTFRTPSGRLRFTPVVDRQRETEKDRERQREREREIQRHVDISAALPSVGVLVQRGGRQNGACTSTYCFVYTLFDRCSESLI
jgi:hypothetical protein